MKGVKKVKGLKRMNGVKSVKGVAAEQQLTERPRPSRLHLATAAEPGLELYGENMTAIHSIEYGNLGSHFSLFGAKRAGMGWLPWAAVRAMLRRWQSGLPQYIEIDAPVGDWGGEPTESRACTAVQVEGLAAELEIPTVPVVFRGR